MKKQKKVPLSYEERIEQEIKQLLNNLDLYDQTIDNINPPPETRRMSLGDPVILGGLLNPVLVAKEFDDKILVVESDVYDKYTKSVIGTQLNASFWHDVFPKSILENKTTFHELQPKHILDVHKVDIASIIHYMTQWKVNPNPVFQRDYVWTLEDKQKLIQSIFKDNDIGTIIFARDSEGSYYDIIDGKQRISAIMDFYESRIPFEGKFYHELSRRDMITFERKTTSFCKFKNLTMDEKIEIFLNVNASGVPQTEEHLETVRNMKSNGLKR